jgi:hypothetical protein
MNDSRRDTVTMFFLSCAVMMLATLGSFAAFMLCAFVGFFFDPFGGSTVPVRVAIGFALLAHLGFFWIGRPRPPHYLP